MNLLERSKMMAEDLVEIRRDLHRHPELSFQETRTARIVCQEMEALGLKVRNCIGKTGVVADLENGDGPVICLRADMDALPITEVNDHEFTSEHPGKMHACGHDGHVAGLIGAARLLVEQKHSGSLPDGSIRFVFQPSEECADEEGLSGAMRMVQEGVMEGVDAIVGLHIGGALPTGKLFFASGPIMAGAQEITVNIAGKSSHAALPSAGIDALVLAAQGIVTAQQGVSRNLSPMDSGVLTFGTIRGGTATNVLADLVTLRGTMRFFSEEVQKQLKDHLNNSFRILEAHGAKVSIEFGPSYLPVINNTEITDWVKAASLDVLREEDILPLYPMMFAEDFSFFSNEVPGCFFWLGAALPEPRMHHSTNFDFDETCLPLAAVSLACGAIRLLQEFS
ncbi:MAG: peptidase M20 [Gemmatimonadetes bacterium]|nr:peptidase M20 [Gemmatimonadota bacterium]